MNEWSASRIALVHNTLPQSANGPTYSGRFQEPFTTSREFLTGPTLNSNLIPRLWLKAGDSILDLFTQDRHSRELHPSSVATKPRQVQSVCGRPVPLQIWLLHQISAQWFRPSTTSLETASLHLCFRSYGRLLLLLTFSRGFGHRALGGGVSPPFTRH